MNAEQVRAGFPGWDVWPGFEGVVYAWWRGSTPPVVVRAHNYEVLSRRCRVAEARAAGRMRAAPG